MATREIQLSETPKELQKAVEEFLAENKEAKLLIIKETKTELTNQSLISFRVFVEEDSSYTCFFCSNNTKRIQVNNIVTSEIVNFIQYSESFREVVKRALKKK